VLLTVVVVVTVNVVGATAARADEDGGLSGRVDLGLYQAIHGSVLATEWCEGVMRLNDSRCQDDEEIVAAAALTGGLLGLVLGGVSQGKALMINASVTIGGLNGMALSGFFAKDDFRDEERAAAGALVGQIIGLGAGIAAGSQFDPPAGRVALANSAAFWSALLLQAARLSNGRKASSLSMALGAQLGFVAGYSAWPGVRTNRLQSWIIDLGGLAGFIVGLSLSEQNDSSFGADRSVNQGAYLAGGVLTGLGLGTALAINMFDREPVAERWQDPESESKRW